MVIISTICQKQETKRPRQAQTISSTYTTICQTNKHQLHEIGTLALNKAQNIVALPFFLSSVSSTIYFQVMDWCQCLFKQLLISISASKKLYPGTHIYIYIGVSCCECAVTCIASCFIYKWILCGIGEQGDTDRYTIETCGLQNLWFTSKCQAD